MPLKKNFEFPEIAAPPTPSALFEHPGLYEIRVCDHFTGRVWGRETGVQPNCRSGLTFRIDRVSSAGASPELPQSRRGRTAAGKSRRRYAASHGQKTAAQVAPQGPSRRARPARPRVQNFRYRSINAAKIKAIAASLKVIINMPTFTVYIPSRYAINPMTIEDVKYQNI